MQYIWVFIYFFKHFSASTQNNSTPKSNHVLKSENDLTSPLLTENGRSRILDKINENKLESDNLNIDVTRRTGEASSETTQPEGQGIASAGDSEHQSEVNDSNLPEGFFDDPVQDAKVKLKYILQWHILLITKWI